MKSIWSQTVCIPDRTPLEGDVETEVAVIGGGMAGVLTAHLLQDSGIDVVMLEARQIGSGQSKNTTAKITAQHDLIYSKLIGNIGKELAGQYARANLLAVEQYSELIQNKNIDCHFKRLPSYIYSLDNLERLEDEAAAAKVLGMKMSISKETTLPFPVAGALRLENQAQFHPLALIKALEGELSVYGDTQALDIEGRTIITNRGRVKAKSIVVATHFPFLNHPGYYFMRQHQQRAYVLALEGAGKLDGVYLDADENGFSFRNEGELMLLGGSNHRTGENTGDCYENLAAAAKRFYPNSREVARWSAQDCMTLDSLPYIGEYSSTTGGIYVETGFNKWGMSTSMVAAQLITAAIKGEKSPFADVFSPQRFHPAASVKNLLVDGGKAAKGIVKELAFIPKEELENLPNGRGSVVELEGEKLGVYKTLEGEAFIVSTRCPHLGCQLEWNADELSWDCPCHGSRFDYKGRLLDNPAMEDLHNE